MFSHAPPVPDSYGVQVMYANGFTGQAIYVYRWSFIPGQWAELLAEHGFTDIDAQVQPAPDNDRIGTLIIQARRAR